MSRIVIVILIYRRHKPGTFEALEELGHFDLSYNMKEPSEHPGEHPVQRNARWFVLNFIFIVLEHGQGGNGSVCQCGQVVKYCIVPLLEAVPLRAAGTVTKV
jgi:hypothetical protein